MVVRVAAVLISLFLVGYLLYIGKFIIAPFFMASLLALLFLPFAQFLERKLKFHKVLSGLVCVMSVLLIIGGISFFFGTQFSEVGDDIPELIREVQSGFKDLQAGVSERFNVNISQQTEYIDNGLKQMLSSSGSVLSQTVSSVSGTLGFFLFTLIFLFFILSYRTGFRIFLIDIVGEEHKEKAMEVVREIREMSGGFLLGISLQVIIVASLVFGLLLVFGVKFGLVLAIFSGILNIVPYVGIYVAAFITCLVAFVTVSPVTALYIGIGYVVIHTIDANVIYPFIIGSRVKVNPFFTILGIMVGASLWGILGMFLALPALAIIKIVAHQVKPLVPLGKLLDNTKRSMVTIKRRRKR